MGTQALPTERGSSSYGRSRVRSDRALLTGKVLPMVRPAEGAISHVGATEAVLVERVG
jgi:hypothetical protein